MSEVQSQSKLGVFTTSAHCAKSVKVKLSSKLIVLSGAKLSTKIDFYITLDIGLL